MLENKTIAVVVPCYNEETEIAQVLSTMPGFVDCIVVVDDKSTDETMKVIRDCIGEMRNDSRIVAIQHEVNGSVGTGIATSYKEAVRRSMDVTAVMTDDGQTDYAKGNGLFYKGVWETVPKHRYPGNAFLSILTKIANRYWHIADSQMGCTAVSLKALKTMDMNRDLRIKIDSK